MHQWTSTCPPFPKMSKEDLERELPVRTPSAAALENPPGMQGVGIFTMITHDIRLYSYVDVRLGV